jgi:hypothetical protein
MALPTVRKTRKFAVIFEVTETGGSAYAPDPGHLRHDGRFIAGRFSADRFLADRFH